MKTISSGRATALPLLALALVIGCKAKDETVAVPPSMLNKSETSPVGTSSETTQVTPTAPGSSMSAPTPGSSNATTEPSVPPPSTIKVPPTVQGDAVTLRLALQKGTTLKYQSDTETTIEGGPQSKSGEQKPIKSTSQTNVKVVDVSGGKSKVEMSVAGSKIAGGPDNKEVKDAMEKMASQSNGVTVAVTFDAMAQPSGTNYVKGSKASAMSAGIDTETGFLGISYPERAVKPGDTWTHQFDFKNFVGQMAPSGAKWNASMVTTTFTLKSVDNAAGTAIVGIAATGAPSMTMAAPKLPDKGAGDKQSQPKDMTINFSVAGNGYATVDLKTGTPKEIIYEMSVNTKMPFGSVGQKTKATVKRLS